MHHVQVDAVGRACCPGNVGSDAIFQVNGSPIAFGGKQVRPASHTDCRACMSQIPAAGQTAFGESYCLACWSSEAFLLEQ